MKIATNIAPRKDGTVTLQGLDGEAYKFEQDAESGELVADIEDEATLAHVLATDSFYPVDEADYDAAEAIVSAAAGADESDDETDNEDEGDPNAPPVESNTPPAAPPAKPAGRKPRNK